MSWVIRITASPRSCCKPADQLQDLRLRGDIQRGGRFVGDQDARFGGERQRDHHPLAQSAGQFERIGIDALRRARDADHRQQLDRARPRRAFRQRGMQADRLDELVADGVERRQRAHRLLEHQADLAAADRAHLRAVRRQLHQVDRASVRAAQHDLAADDAAGAFDDAQDGARGDALAAAGFADDAERAAGEQIERGAVHRAHHAFIGEEMRVQIAHREDRFSHTDPPRRAVRRPGS